MMKLYAISDLHLAERVNRHALEALPPHPGDWLIVAGDLGSTETHLRFALDILTRRFERLVWTPGNHDLYTLPADKTGLRGEAKYQRLVAICQEYGVLTPEDPYTPWPERDPVCLLAPVFLLYDYTFRPDHVSADEAVAWAAETDVVAMDEYLLHPDPYLSRSVWSAVRSRQTETRLKDASAWAPLVLISHWPLRYELAVKALRRIPRFSIWCGTRRSEDWHTRFRALAVVYGHLHVRSTTLVDGVRFEEVSLGYARDWDHSRGIQPYLRKILSVGD